MPGGLARAIMHQMIQTYPWKHCEMGTFLLTSMLSLVRTFFFFFERQEQCDTELYQSENPKEL